MSFVTWRELSASLCFMADGGMPLLGASSHSYVSTCSTCPARGCAPAQSNRPALGHAPVRKPFRGRACPRSWPGRGDDRGGSLRNRGVASYVLGSGRLRAGAIRVLDGHGALVDLRRRVAGRILVLQRGGIQGSCEAKGTSDAICPGTALAPLTLHPRQ